ncbi:MAG: M48 family metalloprotease [Candidatus Omnitrophica bacterium]|nr:M48 family metalloprotease [Candidatus Omnitrophota bacterium]
MKSFLSMILCVCFILSGYSCAIASTMDFGDPLQRGRAVDAYLGEFGSGLLMDSKIGTAIHEVMMRMPKEALTIVMNRRRPVLFVDVYSSGTGRFASSSEVIVTNKDIPAFQEGMTIIKISDALAGGSKEAIMGIVAHELAHRVLDHIRRNHVSCQAERESNRLIKSWGFTTEFKAASKEFGQAKVGGGVAGCQEVPEPKK